MMSRFGAWAMDLGPWEKAGGRTVLSWTHVARGAAGDSRGRIQDAGCLSLCGVRLSEAGVSSESQYYMKEELPGETGRGVGEGSRRGQGLMSPQRHPHDDGSASTNPRNYFHSQFAGGKAQVQRDSWPGPQC